MPKIFNSPQGSAQWLLERAGHLTASRLKDALDFQKSGKEGAARRKLRITLATERLTTYIEPIFTTADMMRGVELEPEARVHYECITGQLVEQIGFAQHDSIRWLGASPDGLVGADGLLEIKCPRSSSQIELIHSGEIPEDYQRQMDLQLIVMQRRFCDFMSYDPRLPDPYRSFMKRYQPEQAWLDHITQSSIQFLAEVDQFLSELREKCSPDYQDPDAEWPDPPSLAGI